MWCVVGDEIAFCPPKSLCIWIVQWMSELLLMKRYLWECIYWYVGMKSYPMLVNVLNVLSWYSLQKYHSLLFALFCHNITKVILFITIARNHSTTCATDWIVLEVSNIKWVIVSNLFSLHWLQFFLIFHFECASNLLCPYLNPFRIL